MPIAQIIPASEALGVRWEILDEKLLGPIAQLGARLNGIEKVESSNLSGSTKDNRKAVFV